MVAALTPAPSLMAAGSVHGTWVVSGGGSGTLEIAAPGFPGATFTTTSTSASTAMAAFLERGDAVRRGVRIDADQMTVQASGPGGPLSTAQLGFQGAFNYCTSSTPRPSSCGGSQQTNVPTWNPATSTLVGTGTDTAGASGWFRPTAAITSITLTFSVLGHPELPAVGVPLISDISGTVELESGGPAPSGTTLRHVTDVDFVLGVTPTTTSSTTTSTSTTTTTTSTTTTTIGGPTTTTRRGGRLPATGGTGQGDILAFATIMAVCGVAFYVVARRHSH